MASQLTPATAPLPADLVAADGVETAAILAFTEGPAVDLEGNVYFSDIQNSRIMKYSAAGDLGVFRAGSGRANGNIFDREGRLVTCEGAEFGQGGRRRVTRTDMKTGRVEVLTDRYEGKRYNSPNDVCIDTRGNIFFTDPLYGESGREMDVYGVYRIDTRGNVRRILGAADVQKPNGVAVTPDDRTLYIVDSNNEAGGNRKIWAFHLDPDRGAPRGRRLVYDFGAGRGGDGMRLDVEGNLWVAAGINASRGNPAETLEVPAGVYVISPTGELRGRIPVPEDVVTNLTFGPPDLKTLYITAGRNLYRMRISVPGYVLHAR